MAAPSFTKTIVGELVNAEGNFNTLSAVGDINADGRPDIVICGRMGKMAWFENPGDMSSKWNAHVVDEPGHMECGGNVLDITRNGLGDIINGSDGRDTKMFWWENPGNGGMWKKRILAATSDSQFHDTAVGDVTGDGILSVAFTNQGNGTNVYRVPVPADPTVEPWPGLEKIASRMRVPNPNYPYRKEQDYQPEEGLAVGDIDGDGKNELACGTHWYKYANGAWECHRFAPDSYLSTKVQIGDVDGDGRNEIILSEGDPCIYGKPEGGTMAWFKPGGDITAPWNEHVLATGLLDAHSLGVGDICGSGRNDIFVGEIGIGDGKGGLARRAPRIFVFENNGSGRFTEHVIDEGTGIHDGVLADMRGTGVLDIVGKPLHGPDKWNVIVWFNDLNR